MDNDLPRRGKTYITKTTQHHFAPEGQNNLNEIIYDSEKQNTTDTKQIKDCPGGAKHT